MIDQDIRPVIKTITVDTTVERAFEVFTAELGSWWPLEGQHSIGEQVVDARVEPHVDGRIYEVWADGTQKDWGRVLEWQVGRKISFAWKPNEEDRPPTRVEVTFSDNGSGATEVTLEHHDWHVLGPLASEARRGYDTGWDLVLDLYAGMIRAR